MFRSRVARRVFLLFIVSSLVPLLLLAILSFAEVRKLLTDQQFEELKQTDKNYGLALLDRLLLLRTELEWVSGTMKPASLWAGANGTDSKSLRFSSGFKRVNLIKGTDTRIPPLGNGETFADVLRKDEGYLGAGNTLLATDYQPNLSSRIYLLRLLDPSHPEQGILAGEVDRSYLFGDIDTFDQKKQICVLDKSGSALFCSHPDFEPNPNYLTQIDHASSGNLAWKDRYGRDYLINYWSIFLKPNFFVSHWIVISRMTRSAVLEPVSDFISIFAFVFTLTLAIVALLSIHQIRKNMVPLERIMDGVHRIANRKFNTLVQVKSGDEFEELATSVNEMACTIDQQFNMLSTMAEIDRLILSTLDIEDIVTIVLSRMNDVVPHDHISMIVSYSYDSTHFRIYTKTDSVNNEIAIEKVEIDSRDHRNLVEKKYDILTTSQGHLPAYLTPLRKTESRLFLVLPIVIKDEVAAMICLGYRREFEHSEDALLLACDFSNRVAVALSNASWEEQLYHMAHYDALTGLPNRVLLKDRLEQALAQAVSQRSFVALLFLDVDRFKHVNDSLGHLSGDALLCDVARRIKGILGGGDTVCRMGGDEFVIVIQHPYNPKESLSVTASAAKEILDAMSLPFVINDREIFTTASIGVACFPTDGESSGELLKNADAAMYHAKSVGRNNYQFYSNVLNEKAVERLEMENGLRRAVKQQEFEVYYQPKIDNKSNAICGAEALLRWNHPELGRVSPAEFIPLCEETGLIIPIGEWLIFSVCGQLRNWIDQGHSSVRIAINLSPLQFRQHDLISKVEKAIDDFALDPSSLEFEITESIAMEDIKKTIEILRVFDGIGIHLSIDDFGTGYSSLNYLKRFPLDTLKIDQSFIRSLKVGGKDAAIVKAIVMLAHSLGFGVVAEGVETREQLHYLQSIGCDQSQGYYFSPPVPAGEFTGLLEQEREAFNRSQICLLQ